MTAKSPASSVKSREMIGGELFSRRREVFGKHDTVFLPPASPTGAAPAPLVEPIVTSNRGKTTANFRRNAPAYSSMREGRSEELALEFRARKYSDNFTADHHQPDDADYRRSMTDRTRRLSKMRRDFMTSNLHEPGESPFHRAGTRASLPARGLSPTSPVATYKIESPNLFKFPFAEPYATPTPTRRVLVDGATEADGKENEDPEKERYKSLPLNNNTSKIDQQKLFEELVKRYSPQRKTIDWKLPPTRPRVVSSVPKSSADSLDGDKKVIENTGARAGDDDVFENNKSAPNKVTANGPASPSLENAETSLSESTEKNDEVPELGSFQRDASRESARRKGADKVIDLSIPALLEKMTAEGDDLESHSKETKSKTKVKRKRSFLDKLLGRNKTK